MPVIVPSMKTSYWSDWVIVLYPWSRFLWQLLSLKWDILDSKPRGCWSRALCDSFISFYRFFSCYSTSAHLSFGEPWYCPCLFSLGVDALMAPLLKCFFTLFSTLLTSTPLLDFFHRLFFFKKSVLLECVLIAWSTSENVTHSLWLTAIINLVTSFTLS